MAEVSVQQMALTRNQEFMDRVTAMLSRVAGMVLSEASTTAFHQGRATYAQQVVRQPGHSAQVAGPQVVMGVNIVNTTIYDEQYKTATCTATDPELESQVVTLWNSLAGLDTPS